MIKPEGLARLLTRVVPHLAADATRLQMFVDKGRIVARRGTTLGYEERYTLSILVQEYAGDVDLLIVPILAWVTEQQPDLLDKGEPFTFTTEILDNATCDIQIEVELSETVRVEAGQGGGWATKRTDPRVFGLDEFPGVCGVSLASLILNDDLAAQSTRTP